jgi:hypothetical protein
MASETNDSTGYRRYLSQGYLASLPERTARAGATLAGGFVYETGEVMLPDAVRRSKLYLRVLAAELRDAGVLAAEGDVSSFEELLSALEGTSGVLADTVDVPPLNVSGVRTSWQELQMQAADLPDAAALEKIYSELQSAARQEDRSILEISSVVALGAVHAGVKLGNVHIFNYYRGALRTITDEGLVSFLQRTSTPYLMRAGAHFDPVSSTYSERLLRRWADRRCRSGLSWQ